MEKPKFEDGQTVIINSTKELATVLYWCYFDEPEDQDQSPKYVLKEYPKKAFKESELSSCSTRTPLI